MTGPQLGKEASGVPRADLSGLFGAPAAAVPDRTQGVPRLAPPPTAPAPPILPPAPSTQEAPTSRGPARTQPAATPARPRRVPARRARRDAPSSVVVYLSISLRQRLRAHAGATGRSHTQVVFDALNATHDRLADLAAARRPDEPPTEGLFVAQHSTRRLHDEDQVQVSIRPNAANLAVIDQLATRHTGGNRSALIALALGDFLPVVVGEAAGRAE